MPLAVVDRQRVLLTPSALAIAAAVAESSPPESKMTAGFPVCGVDMGFVSLVSMPLCWTIVRGGKLRDTNRLIVFHQRELEI